MEELEMIQRRREDPVLFMIHRLSRSIMRASMAYYLQEFGLGVPQVQILNAIGAHGPLVSKDIADFMAMNKALVSRSLSDLTERGYTETLPDDKDARRRLWVLTAKGQEFVAMCRPVRMERTAKLLETLSDDEEAALIDVLERLYASSEAQRRDETRVLAARRRQSGGRDKDAAAGKAEPGRRQAGS
jgi:DNA-binding MarR family transcriptional regulator